MDGPSGGEELYHPTGEVNARFQRIAMKEATIDCKDQEAEDLITRLEKADEIEPEWTLESLLNTPVKRRPLTTAETALLAEH